MIIIQKRFFVEEKKNFFYRINNKSERLDFKYEEKLDDKIMRIRYMRNSNVLKTIIITKFKTLMKKKNDVVNIYDCISICFLI